MIPQNQTGFRKGMGTIDNIYVFNYLVNRRLDTEGKSLIALFVDLKAAFDSVDRRILLEAMERRGVRKGLRERVTEVYKETVSRVKVGEEIGEGFWTGKGVRQGCPLSPLLFNLLTADMEEYLGRWGRGGIGLGEGKVYSLAYADDVVIMAEEEGEMEVVIRIMERYFREKGLQVNVGKTKVMRFRKGGGRFKKMKWRWNGRKVEEVKEFKYLGYVFMRNGGVEAHLKDRVRKAGVVMRQVWGIGKRIFERNWERRLWLFDTLVWTVLGYGVEIWGWEERPEVERMQERYIRWGLGLDWRTPGYMIREETKRDLMRTRAGRRAWNFEVKLAKGKGSELARRCLEEMRERSGREERGSRWETGRKVFREARGREVGERDGVAEEGQYEIMERIDKERQESERGERIRESRYNRWYKEIRTEGVPKYLKEEWREERRNRVARFRLGNEMREGQYWETAEKKICRVCEWEEETWQHVLERCGGEQQEERGIGERIKEILDESGKGEEWMKGLRMLRERKGMGIMNEEEEESGEVERE